MKKFLKNVNKTVQSGADAIANAADLVMLDLCVEKILKKVTLRMKSYDFSTIAQREEIQGIADQIFEEGYEEYDEKVGTTEDEKSNIAVRRRNLRRGFKEKLELFYRLFDEYRVQGQEMLRESQQIAGLVSQTVHEVKKAEASLVTPLETPDLLKIKYDELKTRELNSFKIKLYELNLVHHNLEAIGGKVLACEELLDVMKTEFIDSQEQATQRLWKVIQEEFHKILVSIQEKENALLTSLPREKGILTEDLKAFTLSTTTRISSILPHGEEHLTAISRYMTQAQQQEDTSAKTECEAKEEVDACISLADIQQSLSQLQAKVQAKNVEVVTEMAQGVIATYGYRSVVPIRLID